MMKKFFFGLLALRKIKLYSFFGCFLCFFQWITLFSPVTGPRIEVEGGRYVHNPYSLLPEENSVVILEPVTNCEAKTEAKTEAETNTKISNVCIAQTEEACKKEILGCRDGETETSEESFGLKQDTVVLNNTNNLVANVVALEEIILEISEKSDAYQSPKVSQNSNANHKKYNKSKKIKKQDHDKNQHCDLDNQSNIVKASNQSKQKNHSQKINLSNPDSMDTDSLDQVLSQFSSSYQKKIDFPVREKSAKNSCCTKLFDDNSSERPSQKPILTTHQALTRNDLFLCDIQCLPEAYSKAHNNKGFVFDCSNKRHLARACRLYNSIWAFVGQSFVPPMNSSSGEYIRMVLTASFLYIYPPNIVIDTCLAALINLGVELCDQEGINEQQLLFQSVYLTNKDAKSFLDREDDKLRQIFDKYYDAEFTHNAEDFFLFLTIIINTAIVYKASPKILSLNKNEMVINRLKASFFTTVRLLVFCCDGLGLRDEDASSLLLKPIIGNIARSIALIGYFKAAGAITQKIIPKDSYTICQTISANDFPKKDTYNLELLLKPIFHIQKKISNNRSLYYDIYSTKELLMHDQLLVTSFFDFIKNTVEAKVLIGNSRFHKA